MNVGIFQGSHPERVHLAAEFDEKPDCGIRSGGNSIAFWREWVGTLHEVDCRRCLVKYRAWLRRKILFTERRLAGRDGIQTDAFEDRTKLGGV